MNDNHQNTITINCRKRKSNHTITTNNRSLDNDNNKTNTNNNYNHQSMNPDDQGMSNVVNDITKDDVVQQQQQQQQHNDEWLPFLPLRQLRLEAIFYPKFENEQQGSNKKCTVSSSHSFKQQPQLQPQQSQQPPSKVQPSEVSSIREQMIERCLSSLSTTRNSNCTVVVNETSTTMNDNSCDGNTTNNNTSHYYYYYGYIEVSIKHSGSLVLWSGDTRYYSKNSMQNVFTHTCEVLLRQHFYHYCIAIISTTTTHQQTNQPTTTTTHHDDDDNDDILITAKTKAEELYNQCSQYIIQHRLTLSFEVVTAVLGDHGARPIHDYILLTAIADRDRIRYNPNSQNNSISKNNNNNNNNHIFYTTIEIIEFAQKFHLPHNDYWVYQNALSIQQLFHLYDTSRETGLTSTVIPALTKAAMYNNHHQPQPNLNATKLDPHENFKNDCDYYIQSMYPHHIYQGEILEGIVIRYVQHQIPSTNIATTDSTTRVHPTDSIMEQINRLSRNSRTIVQQLTNAINLPRLCPSVSEQMQTSDSIYTIDLRKLYDETKALYSKKGSELFVERIRNILLQESSSQRSSRRSVVHRMTADPSSTLSMSKQLPIWIETLLRQQSNDNDDTSKNRAKQILDIETYQIAKLISDVSRISKNVTYTIFEEKCPTQADNNGDIDSSVIATHLSRFICIVHVLHDQTFHKYHRCKDESDLPLFRGFSFELIGGNEYDTTISQGIGTSADNQSIDRNAFQACNRIMDDETLMLKMKFLPYMVRTFCCRNGLKVIRQVDGVTAFVNFTNNLMSKWGISDEAKRKWRPYFMGWAQYAQPLLRIGGGTTPQNNRENGVDLPPLSEYAYLDHLQYFTDLYNSGQYKMNECCSRFQGLVVIVAPKIEVSEKMADYVAHRLGGAKRRNGVNDVTPAIMDVACTAGQGIVCNVTIDKSYTTIRKHILKDFEDFVSIVLVQCDDVMTEPKESSSKEIIGYLKGWKSTRGARNIEIPDRLNSVTPLADDPTFQPSDVLEELISQLELPIVDDSRPGLLIFFPTIPGSGKSSLVAHIDKNITDIISNCDRKIYIDESDLFKGKFWPHITKIRRRCYSAINIADKNAPTSAWGTIGTICASTKALAVPVLPDRYAFRTTSVVGVRRKNGTLDNTPVHIYPFSLPYLAVCMTRVLLRPAGSHAGQLDQSIDRLCMIVIKFYAFYRNLSAEQLMTTMSATMANAGAHITSSPIEVPFFCSTGEINLPQEVEAVLLEALQCQFGYEKDKVDTTSLKEKDADAYLDDLELRLRNTLQQYQHVILSMAVNLSDTRQRFVQSLVDKISEVDSMLTSYEAPPSLIQLVAIDIDQKTVYDILQDLQRHRNKELEHVFEQVLQGSSWENIHTNHDEDDNTIAKELGFVTKTHVTLAHYRDMSQSDIRSMYTPYIESSVELVTNALYYNERIMALAIKNNIHKSEIMTNDGTILPISPSSGQGVNRDFLHITIWCCKGVSAFEANALPSLVEEGKACHIEFPEQVLQGSISFWYT